MLERLNEYCNRILLSYLSPVDILSLENVSEEYRLLSLMFWDRFLILNVDNILIENDYNISSTTLEEIFVRGGKTLEQVNMITKHEEFRNINEYISRYCPKIQVINTPGVKISNNELCRIVNNCTKVCKISIRCDEEISNSSFDTLFLKNKEMQTLSIDGDRYFEGLRLKNLTSNLTELKLLHLKLFDTNCLIELLNRCTCLQTLSLYECGLTNELLNQVITSLPYLKYFTLGAKPISLEPIKKLRYLRGISIYTDEENISKSLQTICDHCVYLETIRLCKTVFRCRSPPPQPQINSTYLAKLANLKELSTRSISFLSKNTYITLAKKGKIEILRCRDCYEFDDSLALEFLQHCNNLTVLDVTGCTFITMATVLNAVQMLNMQPNRQTPLKLIVEGTGINMLEIPMELSHHLLRIQ